MKKTYKNVLVGLLTIGLLAGCSTKDVEYDGTTSLEKKQTNVDNKVNYIAGSNEQAVDYNNDTTNVVDNSIESENFSNGQYSTESTIDGTTVTLNSIHFAFDKYNLTENMRDVAMKNATTITKVQDGYSNLKIKLEGNCDEWGTDEYNYALGLKRAKATKDALVADGISADKIILISFGESNPVCKDKNVNCWKMNRRVDYRLLP